MSFDSKCLELAEHFFHVNDPRLNQIAQAIQDTVETFPSWEPSCDHSVITTASTHDGSYQRRWCTKCGATINSGIAP